MVCPQDKELKMFREKQKQEMKLLKQELEMMSRGGDKKENMRKAREAKEIDLQDKVWLSLGPLMLSDKVHISLGFFTMSDKVSMSLGSFICHCAKL